MTDKDQPKEENQDIHKKSGSEESGSKGSNPERIRNWETIDTNTTRIIKKGQDKSQNSSTTDDNDQ
jgi:hypothetical protein